MSLIFKRVNSSLFTIGASIISPAWNVLSLTLPKRITLPFKMSLADLGFSGFAVATSDILHGQFFMMTKEPGLSLFD